MKKIACRCVSGCKTNICSCRKHGIKCSNVCSTCDDESCSNIEENRVIANDIDEEIDERNITETELERDECSDDDNDNDDCDDDNADTSDIILNNIYSDSIVRVIKTSLLLKSKKKTTLCNVTYSTKTI